MAKIKITGSDNVNKVGMTKAIKSNTGLGLKQSKSYTDALLSNGVVEIELNETTNVDNLISDLKLVNADVKLVE